ncbi:MAG: biopolymer transporter ExbD [Xanthomonadales bacterium]|nr:biopolymer transporter ExbD [Gammaproteobacteria bacterium]MBT8072931.1 biopolymer transporter ExbD [Gammaproteobacteria bacterium]NNK03772.1 biopolymer transporter ExbD [Xanthomonadales bacterium]NNK97514.1 biopolymer transporter ExbD [Xanthomonadales bacterium]
MQLRAAQAEDPEISLTGLIDVVFLLLIFFMVSTTFERQAVLKVDLPEATNVSAPQDQPDSFELVIDSSGQFYLNDRQLLDGRTATIEAALVEAAGEDRTIPVILRADAQTPHHFVVTAMDVTAKLGFSRLSIATERITEEESP